MAEHTHTHTQRQKLEEKITIVFNNLYFFFYFIRWKAISTATQQTAQTLQQNIGQFGGISKWVWHKTVVEVEETNGHTCNGFERFSATENLFFTRFSFFSPLSLERWVASRLSLFFTLLDALQKKYLREYCAFSLLLLLLLLLLFQKKSAHIPCPWTENLEAVLPERCAYVFFLSNSFHSSKRSSSSSFVLLLLLLFKSSPLRCCHHHRPEAKMRKKSQMSATVRTLARRFPILNQPTRKCLLLRDYSLWINISDVRRQGLVYVEKQVVPPWPWVSGRRRWPMCNSWRRKGGVHAGSHTDGGTNWHPQKYAFKSRVNRLKFPVW